MHFKCDLSVQILCGLWHTHKFNEHELSTAKQSWIICIIYEQLLLRGTEIEEERNKNSKWANKREFPVCL